MATEKALRKATKELQKVMCLEPPLDPNVDLEQLVEQFKEAVDLIEKGDKFTPATQAVINEFLYEEDDVPVPRRKIPAPKKKPVIEEEEDLEEENILDDEEEDDSEKIEVIEKDKKTIPEKITPRKVMVEEDDEGDVDLEGNEDDEEEDVPTPRKKTLIPRKKTVFETDDDEFDDDDDFEEMEIPGKRKKEVLKKNEDDEEEDSDDNNNDNVPIPEKVKKGRRAPFASQKERFGTSRMIEVAKAMVNIEGSQSIDAIARIGDLYYVKAGGSPNLKQAKSYVKTLLPAALTWGIVVVEKNGKLSKK